MSGERQPERSNDDVPSYQYPEPDANAPKRGPEAQAGCGPADDRGAAGQAQPPAGVCPDCQGSGQIVLLISKRPCHTCGGSGSIARVTQTWRSACYFEQGTGRFLGQKVLP